MKNITYNIKCAAVASLGLLALSSCTDFLTITPSDKTVLEDYWKSKDDVDQMATGAYKELTAGDLIERLIVWGEYRSDEVTKNTTGIDNNTDLDNIAAVNLLPNCGLNSWASFYKVINSCNLVLKHAPEVKNLDPKFTQGDYDVTCAQMKALRSLCYFYLVRTFRDVPYTEEAYENTDQILTGPQYAPSVVLQHCIDDLKEAEKNIYRYGTFGNDDWRNTGLFTRDGVDALLADIYLWRASMTKSQEDYQECVNYADKVIKSRDDYYKKNQNSSSSSSSMGGAMGGSSSVISSVNNPYHLIDGSKVFENIYQQGNSSESILEIQFDGSGTSNSSFAVYYYSEKKGATHGRFTGSSIMGSVPSNSTGISDANMYTTKYDYRFWNNCYNVNNADETSFEVRKMVSNTGLTISPLSDAGETRTLGRSRDNVKQNWIIYRLTDVMLMKAEALVQLASSDDDANLGKAYDLINAVNKRSLFVNKATVKDDSLKFKDYNTRTNMEKLCLAERGRELCFEGKRWYDLLRYCYRHMEGVDITRMLYDIDPKGINYPSLYSDFITLMARKYTTGADAVKYKMKNEAYLYWPVQQREIKANADLHQNPVYIETSSSERN